MRKVRIVGLVLVGVAFGAAVAAGSRGTAAGCTLAGSWAQTTPGSGSSTWVITASGAASERGLGNATGTATLSGSGLRITWVTGEWRGYYEWTLDSSCTGTGRLVFTAGPRAGETLASTVRGPAPVTTTTSKRAYRNDLIISVTAVRGDVPKGDALDVAEARLAGSVRVVGRRLQGQLGTWTWAPDPAVSMRGALALRLVAVSGPDARIALRPTTGNNYVEGASSAEASFLVEVLSSNVPACEKGSTGRVAVLQEIAGSFNQAEVRLCGSRLVWNRGLGSSTQVDLDRRQVTLSS